MLPVFGAAPAVRPSTRSPARHSRGPPTRHSTPLPPRPTLLRTIPPHLASAQHTSPGCHLPSRQLRSDRHEITDLGFEEIGERAAGHGLPGSAVGPGSGSGGAEWTRGAGLPPDEPAWEPRPATPRRDPSSAPPLRRTRLAEAAQAAQLAHACAHARAALSNNIRRPHCTTHTDTHGGPSAFAPNLTAPRQTSCGSTAAPRASAARCGSTHTTTARPRGRRASRPATTARPLAPAATRGTPTRSTGSRATSLGGCWGHGEHPGESASLVWMYAS